MNLCRLVLEILSDIRDPLDDLESEEVQAARELAEKRFGEIQCRLNEIEAKLRKAKSKIERDDLKEVRVPLTLERPCAAASGRGRLLSSLSPNQERGELQAESQSLQEEQAALQLIEDAVFGRSLIVTKALLHSTKKVSLSLSLSGRRG